MKKTAVTIVETLRRKVVVEHPDNWDDSDVCDYVSRRYNDDDVVLTADDFSDVETFVGAADVSATANFSVS